jgi:aldose sugar dehydrogenase
VTKSAPTALATLALLTTAALLAGCTSGSRAGPTASGAVPSSSTPTPTATPSTAPSPVKPSVRVAGAVATGLKTPWGLAFLPDGSALVGERDTGRIVLVRAGGRQGIVGTVPGVVSNGSIGGEAGLLGLALSPGFATDHQLYVYMSTASDNRILRMGYTGGRLGRATVVLAGIPHGLHHNGGRLAFGPDGMLYASTGESGDPALAQDRSSLGGKILRMTPAGRPAPGNPYPGSVVWSYGHRNVEGLAFDAAGRLWATEFGDKAYDELNLVLPGHNYGWPATQGRTGNPRYTSPKAQWRTDDAGPSGIAIAGSVAWIGALTGHRLWRVPLAGPAAGKPVAYLVDTYGRLRTAALAPDGSLWLTTSNTDGRGSPKPGDDRILRLVVS